jgi:hypothetical protein
MSIKRKRYLNFGCLAFIEACLAIRETRLVFNEGKCFTRSGPGKFLIYIFCIILPDTLKNKSNFLGIKTFY